MLLKWLSIGIGIKRWIILAFIGNIIFAIGIARIISSKPITSSIFIGLTLWVLGGGLIIVAFYKLLINLLAPYRQRYKGRVVDMVYAHHNRKDYGMKVVAIGGGTGMPAVLRGLKAYTNQITAVVTVSDDGGSSGKLRRDLGILPPGDIRNNIVALADDESLMAKLFQYRFNGQTDLSGLSGHAFGNLFIAAMAEVSGGMEEALPEVARVLNMQGSVFPSTFDNVDLVAQLRLKSKERNVRVVGESQITEMGGEILDLSISPEDAEAYHKSVDAILEADLIVIGPGSLYTSILPNLLVKGIADALKKSKATVAYVCNVATQPGETANYDVADHVLALEKYIGQDILQVIVANNVMPPANAETHYVQPTSPDHEINQRYRVYYADLTDDNRPWRHDPNKLIQVFLKIFSERTGDFEQPVNVDVN